MKNNFIQNDCVANSALPLVDVKSLRMLLLNVLDGFNSRLTFGRADCACVLCWTIAGALDANVIIQIPTIPILTLTSDAVKLISLYIGLYTVVHSRWMRLLHMTIDQVKVRELLIANLALFKLLTESSQVQVNRSQMLNQIFLAVEESARTVIALERFLACVTSVMDKNLIKLFGIQLTFSPSMHN